MKVNEDRIYNYVAARGPRTIAQIARSLKCRQMHVYWTALSDNRLAIDNFVLINGIKYPVSSEKRMIIRDIQTFSS